MPIKTLLSALEVKANESKWSHEISDFLATEFKKMEEAGDPDALNPEIKQELAWEYELFRFVVKTKPPERNRRFYPMATGKTEDGTPFEIPDIKKFDQKSVDYFKKRVNETTSKILLARYADFIWEEAKEPDYALKAFEAYFGLVDDYYNKEEYFHVADIFDRCVYLIMIGVVSAEKLNSVKDKIFELCEKYTSSSQLRFIIEPIESLLEAKDEYLAEADFQKAREYAIKARDFFDTNKNYHLERSMLELSASIDKKAKTGLSQNEWKKLIAQSHETQAKEREQVGDYLAASFAYNDALDFYKEAGDSAKIDELKNKVIECNKKSIPSFKPISTEIEIKEEDIQEFMRPIFYRTPKEALRIFAQFMALVPKYDEAVKFTEKISKEFVFMHLAGHTMIDANGHIVASDQDGKEASLTRHLVQSIEIDTLFLKRIVDQLLKEGVTQNMILELIKSSEFVTENNLKIIEKGMERHFAGDFFSSIHILVPQIEGFIRNILTESKVQTIKLTSEGTIFATFNELFQRTETKQIFGPDLWHYFNLTLLDPQGWNLRNEVAHGLVTWQKLNEKTSLTVLHLLILLTNFKKIAVQSTDAEASPKV